MTLLNKTSPNPISQRLPDRIRQFLHRAGNEAWVSVILGTTGVLLIALCVYGIWLWIGDNTFIQYAPGDINYGLKIRAVHGTGSINDTQPSSISPASSSQKPEIRLSEKYYDFGEVNANQVLTRTFVIQNLGQSPLVIVRAYTTCGCTTAEFTATEIPPGKVVLMTLQFDTGYHDMRGTTVRRGVMIETNDPDQPTQEIWIQASIR